jgi:hypothetical protein
MKDNGGARKAVANARWRNTWHADATAKRRQRLCRKFSLNADEKEEAVRNGDWTVGDEAFRLRMHQEEGRPHPRQRGRPRKKTIAPSARFLSQVASDTEDS